MSPVVKTVEIEGLFSLANDLVDFLRCDKDVDALTRLDASTGMILSSCRSNADGVDVELRDCQEKINLCKDEIDKAKKEAVSNAEVEKLHNELEEKLQEEELLHQQIRAMNGDISDLLRQRDSIEESKNALQKRKKKALRERGVLSMCASVTKILPNFKDAEKISGYIVDKSQHKAEVFEFHNTTPAFELCNELWKKIS